MGFDRSYDDGGGVSDAQNPPLTLEDFNANNRIINTNIDTGIYNFTKTSMFIHMYLQHTYSYVDVH